LELEKNFQNGRWRVLQEPQKPAVGRCERVRCVTRDYERMRGALPENTLF